jgi:hypothetical protein
VLWASVMFALPAADARWCDAVPIAAADRDARLNAQNPHYDRPKVADGANPELEFHGREQRCEYDGSGCSGFVYTVSERVYPTADGYGAP